MTEEKQLVAGCLKNKKKSKAELFERYKNKVMSICRRYSYSQEDCNDLFQDAFINVFVNLKSFDANKGVLEQWIAGVAVKTVFKHNRDNYKNKYSFSEPSENIVNEEVTVEDTLNASDILFLIEKLPYNKRLVFNLYAMEGYKHHEIAEMLGITEGTSKSQYHKAKQMLQKMHNTFSQEFYETTN